jgi:hypothetical protein
MFIRLLVKLVFSRHQREKRLGYVAEYCRICRKILPFQILEQRVGYHLFFIPIEQGQFLRNTQTCPGCQKETLCQLGQFTGVSHSANVPLETLIATTQPKVAELNKENLATANLLASERENLDPKLRQRLIMEAFGMAESHFQIGYGHHGRNILTIALRPLVPTEDEIRACLQRYRKANNRMATQLHVEDVMALVYPESVVKDPNKFSY